jgi:beta-glucanase (GH16 family)
MQTLSVKLLSTILILALLGCKKGEVGPLPTLLVSPVEVLEGNNGTTVATVQVTLSEVAKDAVTCQYKTLDGSATGGSDYTATSGTLTWQAGETVATISINIATDTNEEINEFFRIELSAPTGIDLGSTATKYISVTLKNDDLFIPTTGATSPVSYPGKSLIWSDEFDGSALNTAVWTAEVGNGIGGWGNNELQYYRAENTTLRDGYMVIEARTESVNGYNYTSSRLVTKGKKEFQYGRIDIRATLPETQGVWPALWMLGANIDDVNWPACGEIDIMELLGHEPNKTYGTVHYGPIFSNHQYKGDNLVLPAGEKFSDKFHVFSLLWEEDRMEWRVDDQPFYTFTRADAGSFDYPFNQPFYFLFNIAVGGNWPGAPNQNTQLPQQMIVDYVRVFQ